MIISNQNLKNLESGHLSLPGEASFQLQEKVLQFGTGVLLRGLPDYFIDQGNRNHTFNGRAVVVKSTSKGDLKDFQAQDSLYTICLRGLEQGKPVEKNIISSAISRVLSADKDWEEVLKTGRSGALTAVISNTTEVGIQFTPESIFNGTPASFPAKLLAVLFERFKAIGDSQAADLAVVATELIPDNGKKLESIVYELIKVNQLGEDFGRWMSAHIIFCNSLVDRIVPGMPDEETRKKLWKDLGYEDELLIMAEPYGLWAIEGDDRVAALLNLGGAGSGLIVKPDIEIYRELKLRLLNGSHTLTCGLAFLSGIKTVNQAMNEDWLRTYIDRLMAEEIIPAIPYEVGEKDAADFAKAVLDRFANPYIEHLWINITLQYTMKMKIRILPLLLRYAELFQGVPEHIALGFAGYLHFLRPQLVRDGKYFGIANGQEYPILDDQAEYFYGLRDLHGAGYVRQVLADEVLWGCNLLTLNGFSLAVERNYDYISEKGMNAALIQAI